MKQANEFWTDSLHVFVLFGFAVAQPLLDLLSRNAEFFVARHSQPIDIVLLVATLCVLLPAVVVFVEGLVGWCCQWARTWGHSLVIMCLVAAIALQALKRIGELPSASLLTGAGVLAIAAAVSYRRFLPVRMFVTLLSPALLIFPGLFLFSSSVFKLVFAKNDFHVAPTATATTTPIVIVIFDELPLTSLMDERSEIDPLRYPNFAALARDATWFRNATTVDENTAYAVPAILTGCYPDPSRLPIAADHPQNLFTWLGTTHRITGFETTTRLCPDPMCSRRPERLATRINSLIQDLSIVYLHLLLPQDWGRRLPSISQNWGDFAASTTRSPSIQTAQVLEQWRWELRKDRPQQFMAFVDSIEPTDQPALYFLHTLLPHAPYEYLPSGKTYSMDGGYPELEADTWSDDEWAVLQSYQRHLLQVGFVDTLLGKLVAHLQAVGLYDRALIVITADHGVSFQPGQPRRRLTRTTAQDLMPVPLFVKAPHQQKGMISDRNVETIDILPTIADLLDIPLPWSPDGRSALDLSLPERAEKIAFQAQAENRERLVFDSVFAARSAALERKLRLFGSGKTRPEGLFLIGPHSEIIGQHVKDLEIGEASRVAIHLDFPGFFASVDPAADFIPAHITGSVHTDWQEGLPLSLAIAINGTIRAMTQPWTLPVDGEIGKWSAIANEAEFRPGHNAVEIFLISPFEDKPVLAKTSGLTYVLAESGEKGRGALLSSNGTSIPLIPQALRGFVDYTAINNNRVEFAGWAIDEPHSQLPQAILVFINGQFLYAGRTFRPRPDVSQWLDNPAFTHSGFFYSFPLALFKSSTNPEARFFAVSKSSVASELNYLAKYRESRTGE
jgi:hypothetical protein